MWDNFRTLRTGRCKPIRSRARGGIARCGRAGVTCKGDGEGPKRDVPNGQGRHGLRTAQCLDERPVGRWKRIPEHGVGEGKAGKGG